MADLNQPATQAEFAALVGITQPQVSDLVRRAVLRPGDTLAEWLHAYCAHIRTIAAGRIEAPEVTAERAALLRAKRERAELELAERRRLLVEVEAVRRVALRLSRAGRDAVRAWPGRIAPLVAAEPAIAGCEAILARVCDELCEVLARLPAELRGGKADD